MSENIQSISQGTYTIGQTSATNFVAGNGIVIDEPSAGTVRIGTDETVLFSGGTNTTAALSENVSSFNYLRVELYNAGVDGAVRCITTFPVGRRGSYNFIGGILSNQLHLYGGALIANGTGISAISGYHQWFTPSTGIGTEYTNSKIEKVIGINRLSGSNT